MTVFDESAFRSVPFCTAVRGRELDLYTLRGRIAGQADSAVQIFRADTVDGTRRCVLKVFDKEKLGRDRMTAVAVGTRIHADLCPHPHIVRVNTVIESPNLVVVDLEHCHYGDLFTILTSVGKLPVANALSVLLQVCDAMIHIHSRGYIHRDIKPENVLIDASGIAKISDFDLASPYSKESTLDRYCGTTEYAAPEMLLGIPYIGPEVDVWSLGVTLFVLLHSRFPLPRSYFSNPNIDSLAQFHDSLSPPSVAVIVQGCLQPAGRQRWGETVLRNVLVEALCSEVGISGIASAEDVTFNFSDASGPTDASSSSSYSAVSTRSDKGLKQGRSISRKVSARGKRGATRIRGVLKKLVGKHGGEEISEECDDEGGNE